MISNGTNHRLPETRKAPILCFGQRSDHAGAVRASSGQPASGGSSASGAGSKSNATHPRHSRNGWRPAIALDTRRRKDSVGDAMTEQRTCTICGKSVDASRLYRYPAARTCGVPACGAEHKRLAVNLRRKNYHDLRTDSDPAYRQRQIERRANRYDLDRVRAGKTPAVREPVAHDPTAIDSFLAGFRRDVATALLVPLAWVLRVLRRRRDRKELESWRTILTRQGNMK